MFATTYSDMQTAAEKCEELEEGYAQCSQFLYGECRYDRDTWDEQNSFRKYLINILYLINLFYWKVLTRIIRNPACVCRCAGEDGGDEPWYCVRSVGL